MTAADPQAGMPYVRTIDGPAIHRLRASERRVRLPEDSTVEQKQPLTYKPLLVKY